MNRRSFLRAAAVTTISLPVLPGCDRDDSSSAQHPANPADTQKMVWTLGQRDSFTDGVNTDYAVKSKGAVFVIRKDRKIYALSSICTHLGCVLDIGPKGFACGCHGSQFAQDGTRLSGPAKRPLVRYAIAVNDADQVLIDKSLTFGPKQADDLRSFIFIY